MSHSFSVDEIQKMRVKLRSSKSYPNDLLRQESEQLDEKDEVGVDAIVADNKHLSASKSMQANGKLIANHDECDNSSSGVSSDQEITSTTKSIMKPTNNPVTIATKEMTNNKAPHTINNNNNNNNSHHGGKVQHHGILKTSAAISNVLAATNPLPNVKIIETINKKSINLPPLSSVTKKISDAIADDAKNANDDFDDLPSPPAKAFQRHNSLTRKQAATIAMNRALYTKSVVSLVQLPPPIEADTDETDHGLLHKGPAAFNHKTAPIDQQRTVMGGRCSDRARSSQGAKNSNDDGQDIVLAPPPEFSDSVCPSNNAAANAKCMSSTGPSNGSGRNNVSVRIVGAVPKTSRLQSH